ncbi:MAG: ATP synthase F1 subunit delta [bacterium]
MIKGSLARRYARALMSIGREQGVYERVGEELSALADVAGKDEDLKTVITAPVIGKDARDKVITALAGHMGLHELTTRFLQLLNQKGRLVFLEKIAEAYHEILDEGEGRVQAEVTSAAALSAEDEAKLKQALSEVTGKQVILSVSVDDSLIGGVVTRVAGKLLDGSVRTQLRAIEEELRQADSV